MALRYLEVLCPGPLDSALLKATLDVENKAENNRMEQDILLMYNDLFYSDH